MKKYIVIFVLIGVFLLPQPQQSNAMTQRVAFQKLWAHIEKINNDSNPDNDYTSVQFAVVTKDQIQNALGLTNAQVRELQYFWNGMAEIIMRRLIEKELLAEAVVLKNAIENFRPDIIDWQNENVKEIMIDIAHLTLGGDPNAIP